MARERVYRYRWVILACLMVTMFSTAALTTTLSTCFPKLITELGIDKVAAGLILSSFGWASLVMSLPSSVLIDRYGLRKSAVCVVVMGIALTVMGYWRSYYSMLSLTFIVGLLSTIWAVSSAKALRFWFPRKERATAQSLVNFDISFAPFVLIPIITYLIEVGYHWSIGILLLAGLTLAAGILDILFFKDPPKEEFTSEVPTKTTPPATAIKTVLTNKDFLLSSLSYFFGPAPTISVAAWGLLFLRDELSLQPMDAAAIMSVYALGGMLRPIAGIINDKVFKGERKPQCMLSSFCEGVTLILVGLLLTPNSPYWLTWAIFFSSGVFHAMYGPPATLLPIEVVPKELTAIASAIRTICIRASTTFFPLAIGFIAESARSFYYVWIFFGLIAATMTPATLLFVNERKWIECEKN